MIVLPAIPAIIAALTPVAEAVLVGAGTGAIVSGLFCGVGHAVSETHIQQELNMDIAVTSIHRGTECVGDGALTGGVFGAVGVIAAPVVSPIVQVADDIWRSAGQIVDDVFHWLRQSVDDLLGPLFGRGAKATHSVKSMVNAPNRIADGTKNAQQLANLPDDFCRNGCNYTMYDEVTGATKSGITTRHPKFRLQEVGSDVGRTLSYRSIHQGSSLNQVRNTERAIHQTFANQRNVSMPGREWFDLNPIDQLSVRAWTP
ncbi:MAG: GIY-YIG nuclease family protein [Chloroflexota bacterium]|nr:GIY-YIG nuclease family protein [Chloroflexota bacterium]MDE2948611.1 GIY-YIG nuclease family protein [Chloroflexota bacterium]